MQGARRATFLDENNEYFVEFLNAAILDDETGKPAEETEGFLVYTHFRTSINRKLVPIFK